MLMNDAVNLAWEKNDEANGYPMNSLQIGFKCCGLSGYMDYSGITFLFHHLAVV
ncbi:hypothetical protein DOY81_010785 [Sarcophaga bullata]|nr:hypothetical protein DOY81_010785 [Sarcophaga bullata]